MFRPNLNDPAAAKSTAKTQQHVAPSTKILCNNPIIGTRLAGASWSGSIFGHEQWSRNRQAPRSVRRNCADNTPAATPTPTLAIKKYGYR